MRRFFMFALIVLGNPVVAAPADFVRGRIIDIDAARIVQRAVIPEDVYEWVSRDDLGDLRVFNSQHDELPYTLRTPTGQREFSAWLGVPIFVMPVTDSGGREGARVNVQVDGGAVISVDGGVSDATHRGALLVDVSGFDRTISELQITWSTDAESFIGKFQVEASDDLDSWRRVVASATLARLETGGQQVIADTVKLPGVRARYLKLVQLDGSASVQIDAVQARSRLAQVPERRWKTLTGSLSDGGYDFVTGGRFPLDRLGVDLEQDTFLAVATLFSRARLKDPWQRRGQHTFYRVVANGTTVDSEPMVHASRDRYWRVELADDGMHAAKLRIGWLPHEVVFLRQGSAPFLLAYGQAGLAGNPWPMRDLLSRLGADEDIESIVPVALRAPNNLGGPDRLVAPKQPPDWQTIVLWAVLVVGVGVIGAFAYRLVRTPADP